MLVLNDKLFFRDSVDGDSSLAASPLPYYKIHAARNRFACKGHCVMSRQLGLFYCTLFLLFGLTAVFLAFDARYLAVSLSPAVPAVGILLFCFSTALLFRASFSDPGILPRATRTELEWLESGDRQADQQNRANLPSRELNVRGVVFNQVYCYTCRIYRPPRASHCSICDNCIDRFDHHCPWIGNCVGARNYRYFVIFVISVSLLSLYVMSFASVNVFLTFQKTGELSHVIKDTPASFVEIAFTAIIFLSVFGLSLYHVNLSCRQISTHEDIRGFAKTVGQSGHSNPFSSGNGCTNCLRVLCGPAPPSILKPWRQVNPDSLKLPSISLQHNSVATRPLQVPSSIQQHTRNNRPQSGENPRQTFDVTTTGTFSQNDGTSIARLKPRIRKPDVDQDGDRISSSLFSGRRIISQTASPTNRSRAHGENVSQMNAETIFVLRPGS